MTLDLYIMRHAPSEGNKGGIIQGQSYDPPLSQEGTELLQCRAGMSPIFDLKSDGIFCSDLRRAKQTAEGLQQTMAAPLIVEPLLREIDPGILSGKAKTDLEQSNPEHMKIWYNRGDYDGIPNAETGRQAQARALTFLYKIQEQYGAGSFVVVAHAAFNRCLVNTIQNKKRNAPVVVEHLNPTICRNVFQYISSQRIAGTFSSNVYRVKCFESDYLVKRFSCQSVNWIMEKRKLLSFLYEQKAPIPELLFAYTDSTGSCEVQEYLHGTTPLSLLNPSLQESCLKTLFEVSKKLVCGGHIATKTPSLDDKLSRVKGRDLCLSEKSRQFLESEEVADFLKSDNQSDVLVDYDCHKDNFVIMPYGAVKKVDISPIWAPPSYQASCWMSALMLDGLKPFDLTKRWPIAYDEGRIFTGLKIRHLIGHAFFSDLLAKNISLDVPTRAKAECLREKYAAGLKALGC